MNVAEGSLPRGACRLTLSNEPAATALACALARAHAAQLGFDERELAQIELGVEEAVSNVVRHAFPADEEAVFDVSFQPTTLGLEILIHDQGLPFDPSRIAAFDPLAETEAQGGLGMHLIRRAFDEVEYRNLGRGGKLTRLLKYRSGIPIGERRLVPSAADAANEPVSQIRLLQADDALDVSRLIHQAYGYSYPYEHIYFPERVQALNAGGELCSAIAVTASGRIAGHAALVIDANRSDRAELAIVVTHMEFRGQGVARRIGDFLIDNAHARGVRMLFTNAVTAHPYTQQFMHQLGFRDCALLPGHAPSSLRFRKIAEDLPQRESCMLLVRYLDATCRGERSASLPAAHRAMIAAIYANLDIPLREAAAEPAGAQAALARIEASIHTGLELAQLKVERWGADALDILRARLAQLRRERMAVIELQLPLCDPQTCDALPAVEALGFCFSGVAPGVSADEDRLVFDFVADGGFDYTALQLHSPLAQALREHIVGHGAEAA